MLFPFLLGALTLSSPSWAKEAAPAVTFPVRRPKSDPPWIAEKHEMDVTYLGFPGIYLTFEVLPMDQVNRRRAYHVRATAKGSGLLSLFFSLNDSVESWFDYEGLFSHRLHLVQDQSDIQRDSMEEQDPVRGESHMHDKSKPKDRPFAEHDKVVATPRFAQDTFSAFFYLRTLNMTPGATYTVPVISEGDTVDVIVTVMHKERLEYARAKESESWVIRLQKREKDGRINPTENLVWIADDEYRALLRVDVNTRFGHVVGHLRSFTHGNPPPTP
jgi:hypothetical protein